MGNNTKSEQDDLCLALINPELCKRSSIEVAIEQHDTETTIPCCFQNIYLIARQKS